MLFLRFVFGLLYGWKIQIWPIIRFLTVSHLLIFYLLVFDIIHDAVCLNKISRTSSRNIVIVVVAPLLSLVTSTSEISHQPVHTYTTYIYDKGVDRTGRQGIEEKYSIT